MEEYYIQQLFSVPAPKMMSLAVKIKEHSEWRPDGVTDFAAFKSAFEEVLAIRHDTLEWVEYYYHHKGHKWNIQDSRNLEMAYLLLRTANMDNPVLAPVVISIKRGIRQYRERPSAHRVISGDHDGYISLIELPGVSTEAEAEALFREHYYIQPVNSQFDCTGRPFTSWYKIFQRNGGWWAYHSVCYDV